MPKHNKEKNVSAKPFKWQQETLIETNCVSESRTAVPLGIIVKGKAPKPLMRLTSEAPGEIV